MTKSRGIMAPRRPLQQCELVLLREVYPDVPGADLAALLDCSVSRVHRTANRLGIEKSEYFKAQDYSGRVARGRQSEAMKRTQFKPGQTPPNKGMKGWSAPGTEATRFQKGNLSHTHVPVGSYTVTDDGYLKVKVSDDRTVASRFNWVFVHRQVWEAANGPVPENHVVVFKHGVRTAKLEEITLDRLECITRKDLVQRNSIHRYPPELKEVIRLAHKVNRKIKEREDAQRQPYI